MAGSMSSSKRATLCLPIRLTPLRKHLEMLLRGLLTYPAGMQGFPKAAFGLWSHFEDHPQGHRELTWELRVNAPACNPLSGCWPGPSPGENVRGRASGERALFHLSWLMIRRLAPNALVIIQSQRERANTVVLYLKVKVSYLPGQLMNLLQATYETKTLLVVLSLTFLI